MSTIGGEKTDPRAGDFWDGSAGGDGTGRRSRRILRDSSRIRFLLGSIRFVAVVFWLTVIFGTLLFVLPRYRGNYGNPMLALFIGLSVLLFLANYFFPFEGYHPILFMLLMTATNSLIAVLVYLTGGSQSNFFLLYPAVLLFSVAYLELPESIAVSLLTSIFYFAPVAYEGNMDFQRLTPMLFTAPIFLILTLCGAFIVEKARQEAVERGAVANLLKETSYKQQELSALYASSLKLASLFDYLEIGDALVDFASELLPAQGVFLALTESTQGGEIISCRGLEQAEARLLMTPSADNPVRMAEDAVLPVMVDADEADERFRVFMEKHPRIGSLLAVPLFASSRVIGILCCLSPHSGTFNDDSARLLLTLGSQAATAIEKAMLYRTTLEDKVKIEAIINTINDGILVMDNSGMLTMANPAVRQLLGISQDDFGAPVTSLFERLAYPWRLREHDLSELLEQASTRAVSVRDELVVELDEQLFFQVFAIPLLDMEGFSVGTVILLHDITDLIRLDRLKSDFISIVSHELKTPLTSIRGFVKLLAAQRVGEVNEKQRHYLEIVEKQAESLTALINDLLDLSRIESGVMEVRMQPISLRELLEEVVMQMRGQASEKGIGIAVSVPTDLPPVLGDHDRLRQVFFNLLDNAIKFTDEGGDVSVSVSSMDGECLVKVEDTGVGIPPSDLERIFEKFYQVESSMTRQRGGTGLGLAITKQLVKAQGGDIWARSQQGEGSTFFVKLKACAEGPREDPPLIQGTGGTDEKGSLPATSGGSAQAAV